ncbi:putative aminotransferase [Campylobacter sputorum subsp. sputorum]|uniref:Putative aminotransferase n=1 Tax=Campylobacter sputorum subsp. sputorum TaxID=32024 RepID=A0A381F4A9_9BACT|nr:putative aminotransferase [Campylobacter sputorum subsp. sputorum]
MPIYSFNFKDKSPYDITEILSNKFGIQARAGCACAGPYGHDLLNLQDDGYFKERPGFVRIGLHYTHNKDDLDYLLGALNDISNY